MAKRKHTSSQGSLKKVKCVAALLEFERFQKAKEHEQTRLAILRILTSKKENLPCGWFSGHLLETDIPTFLPFGDKKNAFHFGGPSPSAEDECAQSGKGWELYKERAHFCYFRIKVDLVIRAINESLSREIQVSELAILTLEYALPLYLYEALACGWYQV